MQVYLGMLLVIIAVAYVVVRFVGSRSVTGSTDVGEVDRPQARNQSHRRKSNGSNRSASQGSRGNSSDKGMKMASGRSAVVTGSIRKPWGW